MDLQRALDVSNYSGPFSVDQARAWRSQGYEHLVCGTQDPSLTQRQLRAAVEAGFSVDAYVYLYWRRDVAEQVRQALAAVEGFPVGVLWLDCEDGTEALSPARIVSLIARAAEAAGGRPVGIYTGRWWWLPATGDSTAFSALPLWHAEYTSSPELVPDFGAFKPYGGWSRPAMWQYRGSTSVCGVNVDLDLRDPAAFALNGETLEKIELALLRSAARFERALALGRYVFRPVAGRPGAVELQRLEGGSGVSFNPPLVLDVD